MTIVNTHCCTWATNLWSHLALHPNWMLSFSKLIYLSWCLPKSLGQSSMHLDLHCKLLVGIRKDLKHTEPTWKPWAKEEGLNLRRPPSDCGLVIPSFVPTRSDSLLPFADHGVKNFMTCWICSPFTQIVHFLLFCWRSSFVVFYIKRTITIGCCSEALDRSCNALVTLHT